MPVVSIRIDEELYSLLRHRAYVSDLSFSRFLRPAIEQAVTPGSKGAVTGQDEVLAICIQTFAWVSVLMAEQSPEICQKAQERARQLLVDRGLSGGDKA